MVFSQHRLSTMHVLLMSEERSGKSSGFLDLGD